MVTLKPGELSHASTPSHTKELQFKQARLPCEEYEKLR